MIDRWRDAKGVYRTPIIVKSGQFKKWVLPVPDGEYRLVIEFTSTGYWDSGSYWHPPEGDDERCLEVAFLEDGDRIHELPSNIQDELFDLFNDEVYNVEIDRDYV